MYREKIITSGDVIEHELSFVGSCGRKGEKRAAKKRRTPEQIRRQNQWNKEKTFARKVRANFKEHESSFDTLTYEGSGVDISIEQVKKDKSDYITAMRKIYKKHGAELKWMCRIEVGTRGGKHLHMITNYIPGLSENDMKKIKKECWDKIKHSGRIKAKETFELKDDELAKYFLKVHHDDVPGQMSWMSAKDLKAVTMYSCSRNLEDPKVVVKEYKKRTIEKTVRDGITPTPGYYVAEESVIYGINPFTGHSYLHYREYRCLTVAGRQSVPGIALRAPWEDI